MPMPVKELEQPQRSLDEKIVEFLANDPENAYTAFEIMAGILSEGKPNRVSILELVILLQTPDAQAKWLAPYTNAINSLERAGRVRRLSKDGEEYFAYSSGQA